MNVTASATSSGWQYDFMAQEWDFQCPVCKQEFYTPTKKAMQKAWDIHTHKICGGGW